MHNISPDRNLKSKDYTLKNKDLEVRRLASSAFKKNQGIFVSDFKFVDSVEFKVGEKELNGNAKKTDLKLWGAEHHYGKIENVEIKESVFAPSGKSVIHLFKFANNNRKAKKIVLSLDAILSLDLKNKLPTKKEFHIEWDDVRNALRIYSEHKFCIIGFGTTFDQPFAKRAAGERSEKVVEHELARKYSNPFNKPFDVAFRIADYRITFEVEGKTDHLTGKKLNELEIPVIFSFSFRNLDEAQDNFDHFYANWKSAFLDKVQESSDSQKIDTPNEFLNKAFSHVQNHIVNAKTPNLWTSLALMSLGRYKKSANIIQHLKGPEFLIAENEYYKLTKESFHYSWHEFHFDKLRHNDYTASSFAEHVLWIEALKDHHPRTSALMKRRIGKYFWEPEINGFYGEPEGTIDGTANFLVPIIFRQIENKEAELLLLKLKKEFSTYKGMRKFSSKSRALTEFHKSHVFAEPTALAACAFLSENMPDDGLDCLEDLSKNIENQTIGAFNEMWSLEKSDGNLVGIDEPAMALFVLAIDNYLFGMKKTTENRKEILSITPRMPSDWKYMERSKKKIGATEFDFRIEKHGNRYEGILRFEKNSKIPKYSIEIVLPEIIKEINVNGKIEKGHKASFIPEETNVFIAVA